MKVMERLPPEKLGLAEQLFSEGLDRGLSQWQIICGAEGVRPGGEDYPGLLNLAFGDQSGPNREAELAKEVIALKEHVSRLETGAVAVALRDQNLTKMKGRLRREQRARREQIFQTLDELLLVARDQEAARDAGRRLLAIILQQENIAVDVRAVIEVARDALCYPSEGLTQRDRERLARNIGPLRDPARTPPPALRARILLRDDFQCLKCGGSDDLHIDHIIPWSRGGETAEDNLQTLCGPCNIQKGRKIIDYRQ